LRQKECNFKLNLSIKENENFISNSDTIFRKVFFLLHQGFRSTEREDYFAKKGPT